MRTHTVRAEDILRAVLRRGVGSEDENESSEDKARLLSPGVVWSARRSATRSDAQSASSGASSDDSETETSEEAVVREAVGGAKPPTRSATSRRHVAVTCRVAP